MLTTHYMETCDTSPTFKHSVNYEDGWEHNQTIRIQVMTCKHCNRIIWGWHVIQEEDEPC